MVENFTRRAEICKSQYDDIGVKQLTDILRDAYGHGGKGDKAATGAINDEKKLDGGKLTISNIFDPKTESGGLTATVQCSEAGKSVTVELDKSGELKDISVSKNGAVVDYARYLTIHKK